MDKSTTTVMLDREVVKMAKIVAAEEGITLKQLVETSMLAYLSRWPRPKSVNRRVAPPTKV